MIHILLADDHPIVREGLRAVLETQPDFEVIGTPEQAANGDEALRLALELQPDILLLDLEMPVMDGVETIRRLRQPTSFRFCHQSWKQASIESRKRRLLTRISMRRRNILCYRFT